MNFFEEVRRRQIARVGALKIVTYDEEVCLRRLRDELKGELLTWSFPSGYREMTATDGKTTDLDKNKDDADSIFTTLLQEIRDPKKAHGGVSTRIFLGVDELLKDDDTERRAFLEAAREAKKKGVLLIVLARSSEMPAELQEVTVLYHPLPSLKDSLSYVQEQLKGAPVAFADVGAAVAAMQGLTVTQQNDAVSLARADVLLCTKTELDLDVIRLFKEKEVGKLGFLSVMTPTKTFDDLLGHGFFKKWTAATYKCFHPDAKAAGLEVPKGILLTGPPGTGKSRIVEAIAESWGVPLLNFDVGAVFSKWQGQTEAQMSQALAMADRMAPCVLLIDEVERVFGKSAGGGDGGSSERVTGRLLSWLANKSTPVFVVFTANFAQRLPAALIRKGRLDEIFAMDFPSADERKAVLRYYLEQFPVDKVSLSKLVHKTENYAPSELEACVKAARKHAFAYNRLANTDDVLAEIEATSPISKSQPEDILEMRQWALEHARSTTTGLRGER